MAELKAYKRLVMEFLDEAVRGSTSFLGQLFDRRGRHRVFASSRLSTKARTADQRCVKL